MKIAQTRLGRGVLRRRRGLAVLLALAVTGTLAQPAFAVPSEIAVAPATTTVAVSGASTPLSGLAVTGASDGESLAVTLSTDVGEVSVDTAGGIALAYGNAATGASVSFTGTPSQVNAALAAAELAAPTGSTGSTATVGLTAYSRNDDVVYEPSTGHFYQYVAVPPVYDDFDDIFWTPVATYITWDQARAAAQGKSFLGEPGYLVTIPSAEVNTLVSSRIENAQNVWIGAHAVLSSETGVERRTWQWADGPLAGTTFTTCANLNDLCSPLPTASYSAWSSGEPNNSGGTTGVDNEWVAVTNWGGAVGLWNDLPPSGQTVSGYVVEYGSGSTFPGVATTESSIDILGLPGAPTGVSAASGSEQLTVTFTAPASDGGSEITGYTVTASPGGATAACASSPCTLTGLTAGTSYTVTVTATSAVGTSAPSSASAATLVWPQPSPAGDLAGFPASLLVGTPYAGAVTATGFPAPTFSVISGALPAGIALNPATGALTGTPSATGTFTVEIAATNDGGGVSRTFTGVVAAVPSAVLGDLGDLTFGIPAEVEFSSTGWPTPTWAVTAGALPAGLVLDASTGRLAGTPTLGGAYAFTLTATNSAGSSSSTQEGVVAALVPDAPTDLRLVAGNGSATVTFSAPAVDGGSAVTGYEVDLGAGWVELATTGTSPVRATLDGLTNGRTYTVQVRAVNAVGAGPASEASAVHPVLPPPAALDAPTVVAGRSSVTVTWSPSTDPGVTGYTVTSDKGEATCTVVAGTTSCVLGATAGVETRYRVVVHSIWGDSDASAYSGSATALSPLVPDAAPTTAPATLTTTEGQITSIRHGQTITVLGTGFAPYSTALVVLYSTPIELGRVVTDVTGSFSLTVTVPTDLEAGSHTFVAFGVDASGVERTMRLPVDLPGVVSTQALAATGSDVLPLVMLSFMLVLMGAGSMVVSRRRQVTAARV